MNKTNSSLNGGNLKTHVISRTLILRHHVLSEEELLTLTFQYYKRNIRVKEAKNGGYLTNTKLIAFVVSNMKFGKHLEKNLNPEWRPHYIAYEALKKLIKEAELSVSSPRLSSAAPRTASLTVSVDRGDELNELFFARLNTEVNKVSQFTEHLMEEIRKGIDRIQRVLDSTQQLPTRLIRTLTEVRKTVELRYDTFLRIRKRQI